MKTGISADEPWINKWPLKIAPAPSVGPNNVIGESTVTEIQLVGQGRYQVGERPDEDDMQGKEEQRINPTSSISEDIYLTELTFVSQLYPPCPASHGIHFLHTCFTIKL